MAGRSDFVWSSKRNVPGLSGGAVSGGVSSGINGSIGSGITGGGVGGGGWGLEFYDCVINNDLERLETLVERHKIDLDAKFTEVRKKNHLDLSPIHLVAYKGYAGMLQYLYDMKCDIHLTTATLRRTPFHFAVLRHKMACFHKLLSFGAKPDARDTFGNTPCHYAAEDGDVIILDVLLRHRSVDPNAQDITGKTPLMKATRNGKLEAVKRLLASGCSVSIRDRNSDTALHFAARHGNTRLLSALILASAGDINMQNAWGHTSLMEAVCYSNKDAAARLLEAGCDLNLREVKAGESALHVSVRKNYTVITDQLLAAGAGLRPVYNYQGERAFYDAIVNQKLDTVRLFLRHNYDLDVPCKLDYDGTGGKLPVRVAVDRDLHDILHLFARVGYVFPPASQPSAPIFTTSVASSLLSPSVGSMPSTVADGMGSSSSRHIIQLLGCSHGIAAADEMQLVRSLKVQCRRQIRRLLGFGIERKTSTLPLPASLKNFVLLKDILDE